MKTVLVTGASGFTGIHLTKHLQGNGYDVIGTGLPNDKDVIACDIMDAAQLGGVIKTHRPDYIIHLAGISSPDHPEPREFYDVNLFGTERLLQAVYKYNPRVKKVILASSANVYGRAAKAVIDESLCPAPVNHYASSKLAMEHMAASWFDKLPILITRPFNYTGQYQNLNFIIPKILHHYKYQKPRLELGNIDVERDFSDVRDICEYYRKLLEAPQTSKVVNLCSGTLTSLKDIISLSETLTNHKLEVAVNPKFVRQNEISKLCGSQRNLIAIIGGVDPKPLEDTLDWVLETI